VAPKCGSSHVDHRRPRITTADTAAIVTMADWPIPKRPPRRGCETNLRIHDRYGQPKPAVLGLATPCIGGLCSRALRRPHRQARPDLPGRYGADTPAIAGLTGAFVNPDPVYLQSTGFVLDPEGKVVVSVYSSGATAAGEGSQPPSVRDMPPIFRTGGRPPQHQPVTPDR
jgi:hypothetical protein